MRKRINYNEIPKIKPINENEKLPYAISLNQSVEYKTNGGSILTDMPLGSLLTKGYPIRKDSNNDVFAIDGGAIAAAYDLSGYCDEELDALIEGIRWHELCSIWSEDLYWDIQIIPQKFPMYYGQSDKETGPHIISSTHVLVIRDYEYRITELKSGRVKKKGTWYEAREEKEDK